MKRRLLIVSIICLFAAGLQACRHPLVIVGEGDIVDTNNTGRGCTLEQFRENAERCRVNEVTGDYFVNYRAEPRPGWRFVKWEGPCAPDSDFQYCRLHIPVKAVHEWETTHAGEQVPPSTAVFQRIAGNTGFLLAGKPVAGVKYMTPTQEGFTGRDGSFQFAQGETVRFSIGATVLGDVAGKARVTPFDLAGLRMLTGVNIPWALGDDQSRFPTLVSLVILLHSLDHDADPENGIEIRPGVTDLLSKVNLELHRQFDRFFDGLDPEGGSVFIPREDWSAFYTDPTFRHVLGLARRGRRFSVPHGVVGPATAMANLYETLGVDPQLVGIARTEGPEDTSWASFDYDANGNLARHDGSAFEGAYEFWQYDNKGNVVRHEQHAESVNHHMVETWEYDGNGNVVQSEWGGSSGYGGMPREIRTGTYDNDNNRKEWSSVRTDEDSTEKEFSRSSYAYDRFGRLARFAEEDDQLNSDGSRFQSMEFFEYGYDAAGRLRQHMEARDAPVADGVPETIRTTQIDKNGDITRYEWVFAPEMGVEPVNLVEAWQYDSERKVTRHESSGKVWLFRYEYDDKGNVTRRERVNSASNAVDEVVLWQYDSDGRPVQKEACNDMVCPPAPGAPVSIETWQYHPNGEVKLHGSESISGVMVPGEIPSSHVTETHQYNQRGQLTRYVSIYEISELDYLQKTVKSWRYNAAGNLTREQVASDSEGTYTKTWTYDEEGKPVRSELDQESDGTVDETISYQYTRIGWGVLFGDLGVYGGSPLPPRP